MTAEEILTELKEICRENIKDKDYKKTAPKSWSEAYEQFLFDLEAFKLCSWGCPLCKDCQDRDYCENMILEQ